MHKERKLDTRKPLDMLRFIVMYPLSFPGLYEHCAMTQDGGLICSDCVKENYKEMFSAAKNGGDQQWEIVGIITDCQVENASCAHCSKEIGYQIEEE